MRSLRYVNMSIAALALVGAASRGAAAADPEEIYKVTNLATATEVVLATAALIGMQNKKLFEGQWIIRASDRSWVAQAKGAYEYSVGGFLWGGDSENWEVTYSGRGYGASQSISVNGKAEWLYDEKLHDHVGMKIDHIVKFGENSTWGWIRGSEIIVGGALGGVSGVIAAAGTPAAIILGVAGAIGGAASTVTLSDVASEFVDSHEPTPPKIPSPPPLPQRDQQLSPKKDQLVVAVSSDQIFGRGLGLSMDGSRKADSGTGSITPR